MTDPIQQHEDAIRKIANKVDQLVNNPSIKTLFIEQIGRFCKMVEDYGEALQSYRVPFRKTLEDLGKNPSFCNMSERELFYRARELCPSHVGWVDLCRWDTRFVFVNGGPYVSQPEDAVNPVAWLQPDSQSIHRQRKATEDEKLMCDFVLLAVIHDRTLRGPTDKHIFSDDYEGQWFDRKEFRKKVSDLYCYDVHSLLRMGDGVSQETCRKLKEKLSELNRIFERVQSDLASTKQIASPAKGNRIWHYFLDLYERTSKAFFDSVLGKYGPK